MAMSMTGRKRIRRRFGHIREAAPIPESDRGAKALLRQFPQNRRWTRRA